MNDWRLTNQLNYLKGKTLILKKYIDRVNQTDHDHCEFCLDKFSDKDSDINVGYCTEDEYYWICPHCYNDFKSLFQWK